MNTNDLKKELFDELKLLHGNVYYRNSEAKYPKVVFSIDSKISEESSCIYQLDVDIWDKDNSVDIDDIADAIEERFNRLNLNNTEHSPIITLNGRTYVDDPDKNIQHILIRASAQVF